MIAFRSRQAGDSLISATFVELKDEVEAVLYSWVEEGYRNIIDTTEYLDSSQVKRID